MDDAVEAVITVESIKTIRIQSTIVSKLNLADFQNSVPVIRELRVINETNFKHSDVTLTLTSSPEAFKPKSWRIDALMPGAFMPIPGLDLMLDGSLLGRLTEAENATVTFVLTKPDPSAEQGIVELAREEQSLELLPRNQWGGLSHLPDMTAAFVQPNDLAVDRLLKQAADLLRKSDRSSALDGYAGGARRAWEVASAIWGAVARMNLHYALPPASFERSGQKVRSPSQISDSGLATCFDLALFFSAALEQAGLNPVLVFTEGHAFAGLWLKAEEFTTTVVDDVTSLRKRLKLKELVLFETTLVAQHPVPSFTYATERGAQQVSEDQDDKFHLLLDVRRARLQRIKPLASAQSQLAKQEILDAASLAGSQLDVEDAPALPDERIIEEDLASLDPKDRLGRWQRKLLDLSLRNNLLNFKQGKKSLKFEAPEPAALEDILAGGQAIKLLTRPDLMDGADPRDQVLYEAREREDVRRLHALDALKRREVFVALSSNEMNARLIELYRGARTTLQEGGSNTLYLALGFLSWTRDDRAGQKYRAPLVLIPVSLERKSARSGFSIVLHDEEPRFNPTLVEMLRQDFELNLSGLEGELPRDASGIDIEMIWKTVARAIKDIPGWEVNEDVLLSMFSFAKYLMWQDLVLNADKLRESPVVRHLLDTPREAFPSDIEFPESRRLDIQFNPREVFCPLPADSSQLSAVMAASKGKDFVLIGPPGTGKSQTIANLIAQSVAQGKRVLFVSEKIAALDVVYRRLREVGIGEFCLEVHSSKTKKTDVLSQLQSAWDAKGITDAAVWHAEADRLQVLREGLNTYVESLHKRYTNDYSIFDAIGLVCSATDVAIINLSWASPHAHSREDLLAFRELSDRLEVNAQALGYDALATHPLGAVTHSDWSPSWQQQLAQAAREMIPVVRVAIGAVEKFVQAVGLPQASLHGATRDGLTALSLTLPMAAGHDWRFALRPDSRVIAQRLQDGCLLVEQHRKINQGLSPGWSSSVMTSVESGLSLLEQRAQLISELASPWSSETLDQLAKASEMLKSIQALKDQLSAGYGEGIEQLNVRQLLTEWQGAEQSFWPKSWLGTKRVAGVLAATVNDAREPDVVKDLCAWLEIRELREGIEALQPKDATVVWVSTESVPSHLDAAIRYQLALTCVLTNGKWTDSDLEQVANGECGDDLKADLARMRAISRVDQELSLLCDLGNFTDTLWQGLSSKTEVLKAAVAFQRARRAVSDLGALDAEHDLIVRGLCGVAMKADLEALQERAKHEKALEDYDDLRDLTGGVWSGLKTKLDVAASATSFQSKLASAIAQLAATPDQIASYKGPLHQLLGDANALLESEGPIVQTGLQLRDALEALRQRVTSLAGVGHFSADGLADIKDAALSILLERCEAIVRSEHGLRAWCAWCKVRDQASATGLVHLVRAMEEGHIEAGGVRRAFETNYARWWLNAVVDNEPVIRGFVSVEHEQRIRDFRALDDRFTELTRDWLRARLCADLPNPESISRSSEWGVLRHEMSKKTRHLPLRELMSRIPEALTKLTPCLLMSPLSIAQYLAPGASAFDLVIFDEASQIPVWDAVGAMARGRQVVMVGDPKQLPPTSFFDRAESTADDEEVEADLESILDECISANLATRHLNWHYRSRHESLIAFSNQKYYESKLVTFPSPVTTDQAVKLHAVAGEYEKGGSRTNPIEARALVADVVARLRSPGFRESKLTIGVVTFNGEQQKLIEDLLDDARRKDPTLEAYFADSQIEPLFVKNLESVQGDERDIIYFSITYGRDAAGVVSMNFGPLNRQGGERRLNVAVTRARHELCVFASLKPEQMDLARTQAIGVRDLKHFLEFAERGTRALAEATPGSLGGFDSPFEEAVCVALVKKGWQVHTQVGVSSFRIDLGVVDPDAPGRYLSGVECDGATYHRSATARDRDKLRELVLRGLGWEILRIWSTDWWIDAEGTAERIHVRLNDLLTANRAKKAVEEAATEAVRSTHVAHVLETPEPVTEVDAEHAPSLITDNTETEQHEPARLYAGVTARVIEPLQETAAQSFVPNGVLYKKTDPAMVVEGVDPDSFFDDSYSFTLKAMIAHVVSQEGPILESNLARRIARAHGWVRTGSKIVERVASVARHQHRFTTEDVGEFYWPGHPSNAGEVFRRPANEDSIRPTDEISLVELGALARELNAKGRVGDDLLHAMSRELGLQKLTASSRARLEKALAIGQSNEP